MSDDAKVEDSAPESEDAVVADEEADVEGLMMFDLKPVVLTPPVVGPTTSSEGPGGTLKNPGTEPLKPKPAKMPF